MKALWAVMFMVPWPHTDMDRIVIYRFETERECAARIPQIKRRHKLYFREIGCVWIGGRGPRAYK